MVSGKGSCSSRKSTNGSSKSKFSALIVDDDSVNRRIHGALLSKIGSFRIQTAINGKEAVDLHLAGESFDVILMDMEMPIMDGPQATRVLRAMGIGSIILGATTCASESELREAFMGAGLNECLAKPLSAQKLMPLLHLLNTN